MTRGAWAFARAAALLLLTLGLWAPPALAHDAPRSFCHVKTVPGGLDVRVETAAHLLTRSLALATEWPSEAELLAARERYEQLVLDAVTAHTPAGPCAAEAAATRAVRLLDEPALEVTLRFDCPAGPVTLRNTWRFELDPRSETLCSVDGTPFRFWLRESQLTVAAPPTRAQVLLGFVRSGAAHVLAGADHVLFIVSLVLGAAWRARAWPLRRGLGHVAGVITGFTLGHSVTLIAASLGWVSLPSRVTETVIALSIVVVAAENAWREPRGRLLTAAGFGLVHGLGFASVLSEVGLPERARLGALLAFNGGVELAQLGLVLLLYPPLAHAARRPWFRRALLLPSSLSLGAVAALWALVRGLGWALPSWLGG